MNHTQKYNLSKYAAATGESNAQSGDSEDKIPVIVDEGVQSGRPIQKITQEPSGMFVAYSEQTGSPEKAQVWSLKELKNRALLNQILQSENKVN